MKTPELVLRVKNADLVELKAPQCCDKKPKRRARRAGGVPPPEAMPPASAPAVSKPAPAVSNVNVFSMGQMYAEDQRRRHELQDLFNIRQQEFNQQSATIPQGDLGFNPIDVFTGVAPIGEQPMEEQPMEEQPMEEQPMEEQPMEEQPMEEQPVEEQIETELVPSQTTGSTTTLMERQRIVGQPSEDKKPKEAFKGASKTLGKEVAGSLEEMRAKRLQALGEVSDEALMKKLEGKVEPWTAPELRSFSNADLEGMMTAFDIPFRGKRGMRGSYKKDSMIKAILRWQSQFRG